MQRALLLMAAIGTLAAAGISAFVWFQRRALPYNSQGRFFDESTATVLHEQSVSVFAVLAVSLLLAGLVLLAMWRRS